MKLDDDNQHQQADLRRVGGEQSRSATITLDTIDEKRGVESVVVGLHRLSPV